MSTTEPAYVSVAEAARLLGLSEATIYRRVWDGALPVLRLSENGAIRIPRTAVESPASSAAHPSRAVEASAHGGSTEAA
jgi:excisionase family DNA binding protein